MPSYAALDLGLLSGEIAQLNLDDIDWRASTLTLRHTKSGREDSLPLPATTGKAIAAYLKQERPRTTNRAIFVRLVAPHDQPVGPDLERKTIRQAYVWRWRLLAQPRGNPTFSRNASHLIH